VLFLSLLGGIIERLFVGKIGFCGASAKEKTTRALLGGCPHWHGQFTPAVAKS
jgi:hypothetical protein